MINQDRMDVAGILVRSRCAMGAGLNESFNVKINKKIFRIKMMEDLMVQ